MSKELLIGLAVGFGIGLWIYEWANDGKLILSIAVGHAEAVNVIHPQPESRGDAVAVENKEG